MNLPTGVMVPASWWPSWRAMVARTMRDRSFLAWLAAERIETPTQLERALSPPERGGCLAYRYDGNLAPWGVARARGWAACAEVAAYAAAAALVAGWEVVAIGEGDVEGGTGYSHLRVVVDGVVVDPYEQEARVGQGQTVDWYGLVGPYSDGVVQLYMPVALDAWGAA